MAKFLKTGNARMYIYLICFASLFLLWRGGALINEKLSQLPVKTLPSVPMKQVATDTKSFYPVWIKQIAALKAEEPTTGDVDELFRTKVESVPVSVPLKPQEPDYPSIVRQSVRADAVGDNGAVINGRFFTFGSRIEGISLMRPDGGAIVPVLMSANRGEIVMMVGKTSVVIPLQKSY